MVQMRNLDCSKLYPLLLENQTTAILWLDASLCLRYMNPSAEFLLELDAPLCLGKSIATSLPDIGDLSAILRRVLASQETVTQRELRLMIGSPDARHGVTADCTVSPISGETACVELLVELSPLDRHLRIRREVALSLQSTINRALARNLAHEIKNPLGGLRGAAQLLARRLTEAKLLEYTRIIVSEVDRLTALVDSLLGPPQPLRRAPTNIHEPVEHVLQLTQAATPKLKIIRDYDPSLPELMLDQDQITQALINLAKNAREAAGERGVITFRTRALRQFTLNGTRHRLVACVELEDDGPGIPPEVLPRLFMPMATSKPQGSGLGLSIAQELVSRHGGLIECASVPGATVFSILLPIGNRDETETA
ncbi:MAG: nitrogen regulation protein NR(II) [Gammaproteobacteria bacterium]